MILILDTDVELLPKKLTSPLLWGGGEIKNKLHLGVKNWEYDMTIFLGSKSHSFYTCSSILKNRHWDEIASISLNKIKAESHHKGINP